MSRSFSAVWEASRKRFLAELNGLTDEQLRWRLYPGSLSIGEMAMHVAGVEVSIAAQMLELPLNPDQYRLQAAAMQGVVDDQIFPYPETEIGRELIDRGLTLARSMIEPVLLSPPQHRMGYSIESPFGPITGEGALTWLSFHAAFHQGQAYLIKAAPGFPS